MFNLLGKERNTRLLSLFYIFNNIAISVPASGVITDMFLLNTGIDTVRFGTLKSNTYLLPAIFFILASGFLTRINKDQIICGWCYIFRCAVPCLATGAIVLFSPPPEVIYHIVALMFIVSFTCAAFANNILTRILQEALPPEDFTRGCVYIPALGGIFCNIACIGEVWVLERCTGNRDLFMVILFLLQFGFTLLEIPAYRSITALKINRENAQPTRTKSAFFSSIRELFKKRELGFVFIYMLLHGVYIGMLGAYLAVYLIKFRSWRPVSVAAIEIGLTLLVILTSGMVGRVSRKIGIPAFLGFSAAACAVVNLIWGITINTPAWSQWFFFILIYNGVFGVVVNAQVALESGATTLFSPDGKHGLSIGIGALARATGAFGGSCIASWLFSLLPGDGGEKLKHFFTICAVVPLSLFVIYCIVFMKKRRNSLQQAG